jgi:hypothetical protein
MSQEVKELSEEEYPGAKDGKICGRSAAAKSTSAAANAKMLSGIEFPKLVSPKGPNVMHACGHIMSCRQPRPHVAAGKPQTQLRLTRSVVIWPSLLQHY